jgi:hypothetical protein
LSNIAQPYEKVGIFKKFLVKGGARGTYFLAKERKEMEKNYKK